MLNNGTRRAEARNNPLGVGKVRSDMRHNFPNQTRDSVGFRSSVTLNLAGLGTNPTTGRFWQWRRGLRLSGSYTLGRQQNNTNGAFSVPATDLAFDCGVLTSPTFLQPTSASGVRRTTMNINLTF